MSSIDLPFWTKYSCEFSRKNIKRFGEGEHDLKFFQNSSESKKEERLVNLIFFGSIAY